MCNRLHGDLFFKMEDGVRWMRNVAIRIHSPQKWIGTRACKYKALASLRRCWCFLSTTEFCSGLSTHKNWWITPFKLKNSTNYSFATVSDLNFLIILWNWVSTILKNLGMIEWTFDLCFMSYNHVKHVQSSTSVRKYL